MQIEVVLTGENTKLTGVLKASEQDLRNLGRAMGGVEAEARRAERAVESIGATKARANAQTRSLTSSVGQLRSALTGIGVLTLARELYMASNALDSVERGLTAAVGSNVAMREELSFVRAEAERLGVSFRLLSEGYVQITASAKGTALAGQASRDIFTAIAESARVFNLSQEKTAGTINAVSQIISKGVVSMEELRQQLGDRLPGALQIAARSMNMTTAELMDLVGAGKLSATEFLPAFAKGLRESAAAGVQLAASSPSAEVERMKNALFEMFATIGRSGFMEALAEQVGKLTTAMQDFVKSGAAQSVGSTLGTIIRNADLLVVALVTLYGARGLIAAATGFKTLATNILLTAAPLASFQGGAAVATTRMATMAATGRSLFALVGGWPTIIAAAAVGIIGLGSALRQSWEEQERVLVEAAERQRQIEADNTARAQRARQENAKLIEADIRSLERSMSREKGRPIYKQMAEELKALNAELLTAKGGADAFAASASGERAAIDELVKKLRDQNSEMQIQAIRMKEGESGVAKHLATQLNWKNATNEQRKAMRDAIATMTSSEAALKALEGATKGAAKGVKENERAHKEYTRTMQQLLQTIDPLQALEQEQIDLQRELTEWRKAGAISETELAKAMGLVNKAFAERRREARGQDKAEEDMIERRQQAQGQYEDYLNNLKQDIALLKVSGAEREAMADAFEVEAVAAAAAAQGIKINTEELRRNLAERRQLASDDATAAAWENIWVQRIENVQDAVAEFIASGLSDFKSFGQSLERSADQYLTNIAKMFQKTVLTSGGGGMQGFGQQLNAQSMYGQGGTGGSASGWMAAAGSAYAGWRNASQGGSKGETILQFTAAGAQVGGWVGAIVGLIVGVLVAVFKKAKPPDIRAGGAHASVRNPEESFQTAFGTVNIGTRGGIKISEISKAMIDFDKSIFDLVSSFEGADARIADIRGNLARWSVDLKGDAATPENLLKSRFKAILAAFEQPIQDFALAGDTLEAQVERFAVALSAQAAFVKAGLDISFSSFLSIVDELGIAGEKQTDTIQRIIGSVNLLSQAMDVTGIELGMTGEEFARFATQISGAAGGLERAGQLFEGVVARYYSAEEIGASTIKRLRASTLEELQQIGVDAIPTMAAWRAAFEAGLPNMTPEQVVQWLEAGNALADFNEALVAMRDALAASQQAARDFNVSMAQRLNNTGSQIAIGAMYEGELPSLRAAVETEQNVDRALANLDRFVTGVDNWLSAAIADVEAAANRARANVQAQMDALDAESAAIYAAGDARAAAAQAAQQAQQAAQQAAIEAQRAALQRLLEVAQRFAGVVQQAQQAMDQLRFGGANPLPVGARADMLEVEIAALRNRYNTATGGERADLASQLITLLNQRMQFSGELFQRPTAEAENAYNATMVELAQLRDAAQTEANKAIALQEQLNALQEGTTAAVMGVGDRMAYLSQTETARLEAIDAERKVLEAQMREIDRQQASDIAQLNAEANAYYTWAQTVGNELFAQRHADMMLRIDDLTGGVEPLTSIASVGAAQLGVLEDIRLILREGLRPTPVPTPDPPTLPVGPIGGGGGIPRPPGESTRPRSAAGAVAGGGDQTIIVQLKVDGSTDGKKAADAFVAQFRRSAPELKNILAKA
jgi:tape measure domain-containing protein